MLTSNPLPDTPADFNKLGIKGNNIFDDQLSLNKSVFMHDGLLVNAKIKTGATEYDNILIGGVDYTTGSIFQIKDDNNVMIARCEVTNVYAGMMKKFKIVEAGTETSKIKLGITKAHGGGVGAYISITDSMLDNIKNSILYESDVIVYSDADNKGDGNITMISGILSNKQININPSVGAQICSKIVRTFEPYNNMNKLFYLIGNKVYSQQPLAGPKAVSNLNLTVEESYELQEIKCIIMGFTPSSGGEDKNKDKTIVKNNNKTRGVELNGLINPNTFSEITLDSIEQLEATHDEVIIRGMCKTFKCIGIWDAQYNLFKIYFFNPFMLSSGGFNYDTDYQIDELILDTTIDIQETQTLMNKYIGLEDDGVLPTNKFVKHGNADKGVIMMEQPNKPIERLSKYETKEDRTKRLDGTGGVDFINSFSFMSGGDNIPDSYAMTYIIKK